MEILALLALAVLVLGESGDSSASSSFGYPVSSEALAITDPRGRASMAGPNGEAGILDDKGVWHPLKPYKGL